MVPGHVQRMEESRVANTRGGRKVGRTLPYVDARRVGKDCVWYRANKYIRA
jgi:hypothetical protein